MKDIPILYYIVKSELLADEMYPESLNGSWSNNRYCNS
jgi:hypothetical protein